MTEVFVVREASVQSLAQRYKVDVKLAQHVNDVGRQHADVLLALFVWVMDGRAGSDRKAWEDHYPDLTKRFDEFMKDCGDQVLTTLKRFPAKKPEFMKITNMRVKDGYVNDGGDETTNEPEDTVRAYAREFGTENKDLSKRALLKLPDGSYWVELNRDECDAEGKMMQHCGGAQTEDGVLYSLRDKLGKPHVTVEVGTPQGEARWFTPDEHQNRLEYMRNNGAPDYVIRDVEHRFERQPPTRPAPVSGKFVMQAKGKQNSAPDRKYWPAVAQLCHKLKVGPNPAGGYDETENEIFDWLAARIHEV